MTSAVFHDFPGLENALPEFHDFPGPVGTLTETGQNVPNSISDDATPHCLLGKLITLSLTGGHQSPHATEARRPARSTLSDKK